MTQLLKKVRSAIYVRLYGHRILAAIRSDLESAWPLIESVWSRSSAVYRMSVGPTARTPFELAVLDEILNTAPEPEELLGKKILNDNPQVAAYSLLGLQRLGSQRLKLLPIELFVRKESLIVQAGCFVIHQSLGEFAKQIASAAESTA